MADEQKPLLIKRYASRRLYNTETSDYVTLEDIAGFIRTGRDVRIVDLKSGDDLTRQYLLQIVAEHESKGESVLPIEVLTDLVRSYTTQANSIVPQFLKMSFDMLRDGQSKMMGAAINPLSAVPGFDAMQAQQKAFIKAMTGGWTGASGDADQPQLSQPPESKSDDEQKELDEIRRQLAEMQEVLKKMNT